MSAIASSVELDCKGLNCPLPILKQKKQLMACRAERY